jgi:hypothetical protein
VVQVKGNSSNLECFKGETSIQPSQSTGLAGQVEQIANHMELLLLSLDRSEASPPSSHLVNRAQFRLYQISETNARRSCATTGVTLHWMSIVHEGPFDLKTGPQGTYLGFSAMPHNAATTTASVSGTSQISSFSTI